MDHQNIRGCILPPSAVEQLLHEPHSLDFFKRLEIVCYAGGPLSQGTGNIIGRVTTVCQFYGSTEVGQIRQLLPRSKDWSYMEFLPKTKLEFRPSGDDAFKLIVLANATTEESVALTHNFPEVEEWHTKDLFKPHPTKQDLWRFRGRRDDIVVLSNGEKLNPVPMESQLLGSPMLVGALVTGQNRFQPALLIEMNNTNGKNDDELIDQIWPAVESANKHTLAHGRIVRSMILLAKHDKPFLRAGKGTVVRKLTENAYADQIRELYSRRLEQMSTIALIATAFSSDTTDRLIRSILRSTLNVDEFKDSDNFYILGLDSLKTAEVVEDFEIYIAAPQSTFGDFLAIRGGFLQ